MPTRMGENSGAIAANTAEITSSSQNTSEPIGTSPGASRQSDLLLATRLPVFTRRAKRKLVSHPKFFFFDVGVYRTLRPRGPLDSAEEIDGAALETLVYQELRALNDYLDLGYSLHYWRTTAGDEVDFVLYGERGLIAIEVKRAAQLRASDFASLRAFADEYPMAKTFLVTGGSKEQREGKIQVFPIADFLQRLPELV